MATFNLIRYELGKYKNCNSLIAVLDVNGEEKRIAQPFTMPLQDGTIEVKDVNLSKFEQDITL